jgi:hypothetical protein
LGQILSYAKEQPWVFYMFVLMGQVRRTGMPEEARKLAESADALVPTVSMIERGQKEGIFHKGDSDTLARCFWYAVQGIMEQMATDPEMKTPDPEWIVAMLK